MEAYREPNEVDDAIYYCPECGEEYQTKKGAGNCCAKWYCGWCGKEFEWKKDANKCCKKDENNDE